VYRLLGCSGRGVVLERRFRVGECKAQVPAEPNWREVVRGGTEEVLKRKRRNS
jgi:hypothetical protein